MDNFFDKVCFFKIDEILSENPNMSYPVIVGTFFAATLGTLILLSGCSAVNNGREVMNSDDVICAFNTYFKLLSLLNYNQNIGG